MFTQRHSVASVPPTAWYLPTPEYRPSMQLMTCAFPVSWLFLLLLCLPHYGQAQFVGNYWYFGNNAGVAFDNNQPRVLNDGALDTPEACSVISAPDGSLLMYTDGQTIWNRFHEVMENGTGLNGNPDGHQTVVIVPRPDNPELYYIFTLSFANQSPAELYYSVVDFSQPGGRVTEKNVFLVGGLTERIASTLHCNGVDYWVTVHEWQSNRFLNYIIRADGLDTQPVVSAAGSVHEGSPGNAKAYMQYAPFGNVLAVAIQDTQAVELFYFNSGTGQFSPFEYLTENFRQTSFFPFGVEFSPDNSKLFVSSRNTPVLYRFDLAAVDISASAEITTAPPLGALLLGGDQKIYAAQPGSPFLAVIDNPNTQNFIRADALALNGRTCGFGLPNITRIYTRPAFELNTQVKTRFCPGDTLELLASIGPGYQYQWFRNQDTLEGEAGPILRITESGVYRVEITDINGCKLRDFRRVTRLPDIQLRATDSTCIGQGSYFPPTPEPPGGFWSGEHVVDPLTGEVALRRLADAGNPYRLTYTLPGGCPPAQMELFVAPEVDASFRTLPDQTDPLFLPDQTTVQFRKNIAENADLNWDFDDGNRSRQFDPTHRFTTPGTYEVSLFVINWGGCIAREEKIVAVRQFIDPVPSVFTPNSDGINDALDIRLKGLRTYRLWIYDRWGALVYETDGSENQPWRGRYLDSDREVPQGVYFYLLEVDTYLDQTLERTGTITLMR